MDIGHGHEFVPVADIGNGHGQEFYVARVDI